MEATPDTFYTVFLGMGRAFIPNQIFTCRLVLGTSVTSLNVVSDKVFSSFLDIEKAFDTLRLDGLFFYPPY